MACHVEGKADHALNAQHTGWMVAAWPYGLVCYAGG